jgi:endoglucanase
MRERCARRRGRLLSLATVMLLTAATVVRAGGGDGLLAPFEVRGEAVYVPFPVQIVLDGDLWDWDGVPIVRVARGPMESASPAENGHFTFAVAADMDNFYITMSMPDQNIIAGQHDAEFWNEDSFEFYLNASGDLETTSYGPGIFQANVNATDIGNTDPDGLTITGVNGANHTIRGFVFETQDGWGIEVAVPLEGLLEPEHGLEIGFQAQINGASEMDRNVKLIWSNADTSDSSWSDPSVFGRALFFGVGREDIPLPSTTGADGAGEAAPAENLLKNGDFEAGQEEWWTAGSVDVDASGGELCVTITDGGANPWDVILGQNEVPVVRGQSYTVSFDAWASEDVTIIAKLQMQAEPWDTYFSREVDLTGQMQSFNYSLVSPVTDDAASFQFQIGGQGTPTICFDNVAFETAGPAPEAEEEQEESPIIAPSPSEPATSVHVNQTGYLPAAPKRASAADASPSPLEWHLVDGSGQVVLSGSTTVYGSDDASGDHVHIADFSAWTTEGTGYTLQVGDAESHPFEISGEVYDQLKYDALAYFYHNRSGIDIEMPYAGSEQWARPAGHIGVAPNQGDTDVTCFAGESSGGQQMAGCDYSLDVSGGWYDAGDHGKYVVNGGISVWTLLNQYERALHLGSSVDDFADGTMSIPENGNGVPDILDEARWELEFMLSMQIPQSTGDPKAGMVHHKVHDAAWTGIPMAPDQDPQPRYLYPPTTAATLNLAATAAQGARIWESIDPAFSARCLSAAELAWSAALANPQVYAMDFNGGGSYGDDDVSDEFYWAAVELYITTGEAEYRDYAQASDHYLSLATDGDSALGWPTTAAAGTISLAVVAGRQSGDEIEEARANIAGLADTYVEILNGEGYLVPYAPEAGYYWGSNSSVLNNLIIIALAYDFTRDQAYLGAVSEGMDYILGRNGMDQSYVTGYGERPVQNPHHRFWAYQMNPSYPPPPPGAVSGGPNAFLQDPTAQSLLVGCAWQKCFVDSIESWSTNEITINWNAPLAWVAAFLDEMATQPEGGDGAAAADDGEAGISPLGWGAIIVAAGAAGAGGLALRRRSKRKKVV